MKLLIVGGVALAAGALLGFLLCGAAEHYLRRRVRTLRRQIQTGKQEKMGVMDKVLVLEAVVLIAYTVADLVVFWHAGSEPYTLTGCVFGVCGIENGVMGWIKTNKDKAATAAADKAAQEGPEPERAEPADIET